MSTSIRVVSVPLVSRTHSLVLAWADRNGCTVEVAAAALLCLGVEQSEQERVAAAWACTVDESAGQAA